MKRLANRKIALDVDNVLADTAGVFCRIATSRLGHPITKEMIRSPKIVGSVRADPRIIYSMLDEVWIGWATLPLLEKDAAVTIRGLRSRGNTVIIATSRPFRSGSQVKKWLEKNGMPFDDFCHLGPFEPKSDLLADILVDDDPSQIANFVASSETTREGLIYDQPWNRSILPMERVGRIMSLRELIVG